MVRVVSERDGMPVLVLDRAQMTIGAKDQLLTRAMEGQGRGAITIALERRIQPRSISIGSVTVAEVGAIATGTMINDVRLWLRQVEAHIMAQAEIPVLPQVSRIAGEAVVVRLDVQVNAGAANLHLHSMHQQVAVGNVDQQLFLATRAGGAGNGMLDVGVEREIAQPIEGTARRDVGKGGEGTLGAGQSLERRGRCHNGLVARRTDGQTGRSSMTGCIRLWHELTPTHKNKGTHQKAYKKYTQ